jgi:hypothetical protein
MAIQDWMVFALDVQPTTMRMSLRRFTLLTNAFSFAKINQTLRVAPVMAARVTGGFGASTTSSGRSAETGPLRDFIASGFPGRERLSSPVS